MAVDTYCFAGYIIFLGCDAYGYPHWGEVIPGISKSEAFKDTELYALIRDDGMEWPRWYEIKVGLNQNRRVNTSILIDNQIMKGLDLPDHMKLHIQGQTPWVRGDKKTIITHWNSDNFESLLYNDHNDYR